MSLITTTSKPGLLKLSPELLDNICNDLSRDDLRNLSQVAKHLKASAQRGLFHTIYLKLNLDSFENLTTISKDTTLRKYVERIEYDDQIVEGSERNATFKSWLKNTAAEGFGIEIHDREHYLEGFKTEEFENFFEAHCEYVYGQEYLREGNHAMRLLIAAIPNFSYLTSLAYSTESLLEEYGNGYCPERLWNSLGTVAKEFLHDPLSKFFFQERVDTDFWAFVKSCLESGVCRKLLSLNSLA